MKKKQTFSKLLAIVACLLCALTVNAATYYGFKVGGVSVNSDNCNNVTGNNILSGTVKYDHSTKTVTLTNVRISRTGSDNRAILNESNSGLIVKLEGTNNLSAQDASAVRFNVDGSIGVCEGCETTITGGTENAIYSYNAAISISGPGTLHVSASGSAAIEGKGAGSTSTLNFSNITADIQGYKGDLYDLKKVTFDGKSYVTLTATGNSSCPSAYNIGGMTFNDNEAIRQPAGATYNTSSQAIVLNGNKVYNKDILITQRPDFKVGYFYYRITDTGTNEVSVTYKDLNYKSYNLSAYTLPATVTYDGKTYNVTGIDHHAFDGCIQLVNLNIYESNIRTIGIQSFRNCSNFARINCPNSVTTIDNYAFQDCESLCEITFGTGMTSIGKYAFTGCPEILTINANNPTPPTIQSTTFDNYLSVVKVATPLIASQYRAAQYWSNFTRIIPNQTYDFTSNGIYYLISGNNTVTVTYGYENFNSYSGDVVVPNTVYYNGKTYRVTAIGENAFRTCFNLTSVTLPDNVTEIGNMAFYGNGKLTKVYIGSGCQSIGSQAFYSSNITEITCMAAIPPTAQGNTFQYYTATLTVPTASVITYRNTIPWSYFTILGDQGEPVIRGDVNGDGSVSIADVTSLIKYLLGSTSGVNADAADCNQDSKVTIADVTTLINYLLSNHW